MKTFIVDSSNSMFATSEPLPTNFQWLTFESNVLEVLEAEVSDAICIVYPSFSRLLANSINETGQVAGAQSSLLAAIEHIVYFYKRNRKRCTLLYLDEQNLTSQSLSRRETLMGLALQISAKPTGVMEFITASSLLADREFSKRFAELESCSCGEITFELKVNAQDGVDAVLALQNENEKKLTDAETENAHIRDALAREQEAKRSELEEKQAIQHARAIEQEAAQKVQTETQRQLQELEQENEKIIEQLHTLQELFEEKLEHLNQTERKLAVAKTEVSDMNVALAAERQAVQQSKATEQKAAQEKYRLLQQQLFEKAQENEKLIEQLHYVQELIELEYKNKTLQQKQIIARSQELTTISKRLERAEIVQLWLRSALTKANQRLWSKNRTFRNEVKRDAKVLRESSEFAESQYIEMYPDTKKSSLEPSVHYLLFGAIEARNPSTTFHSLSYIQEYVDVAESGLNPLLHYLRHGQFEGRQPNPMLVQLSASKG